MAVTGDMQGFSKNDIIVYNDISVFKMLFNIKMIFVVGPEGVGTPPSGQGWC